MSDRDQPWLHFDVTPEPTPEEREALVAALSVYFASKAEAAGEREPASPISRWAAAGRREAIQGRRGGSAMGWGRPRPGWS